MASEALWDLSDLICPLFPFYSLRCSHKPLPAVQERAGELGSPSAPACVGFPAWIFSLDIWVVHPFLPSGDSS